MAKKENQTSRGPVGGDPQYPLGKGPAGGDPQYPPGKGPAGGDPQFPIGLKGFVYYSATVTTAILLAILYYIFHCGCGCR